MALTVNREVDHFVDQELRSYQVEAAKHIFKGGFVGLSASGHAQPLVAGDPFVGIAYEEMDNTSGLDGDLSVRVFTLGDFGLTLAGATVADIGRPVFASADDTVTVDAVGNSFVGLIQDVIAAGEVVLRLDTKRQSIKTTNFEISDLPAGVDLPVSAIHGFDHGAWIVGARVVNKTTTSSGIDDSNPLTVAISSVVGAMSPMG